MRAGEERESAEERMRLEVQDAALRGRALNEEVGARRDPVRRRTVNQTIGRAR